MIPGETTEPMALPNIYGDMQLSYNMHLPIQKNENISCYLRPQKENILLSSGAHVITPDLYPQES